MHNNYSDVERKAYWNIVRYSFASMKVAPMLEEPAKVVVVVVTDSGLDSSGSKGWSLSLGQSWY